MRQKLLEVSNVVDGNGNPTGGEVQAVGIAIYWQNGPLGRGSERKEPNGAFVEGVIEAAKQRLEFFQAGKFASKENATAIALLGQALDVLDSRTQRRENAGIEGTHAEEPQAAGV